MFTTGVHVMIKIDKRCKVCKVIHKEEIYGKATLAKRIYNSKAYVKGGEPLSELHRDYEDKFSYQSLYWHTKKHQAPTADQLADSRLRIIDKEFHDKAAREQVKHQDLRQEIMEAAKQLLEEGKLEGINANTALRAAKDASDIEQKEKDRGIKVMEMIAAFQSGEVERIPDVIDEQ